MLDRKQNVFDDFHAAAEYLIATGVTARARLAVWGGSNGGLLVGAAVTQRPDLFAAAVCSAPLLDMVRYERFKIGETWNVEYGSAAKPEELGWLLGYSPYHQVRDGVGVPGGAVHRVQQRHAGRPAARLQDVRRAAARDRVGPAGAAARGGAGGPRAARGVAVGRAVRRLPGLRGPARPALRRLRDGGRPVWAWTARCRRVRPRAPEVRAGNGSAPIGVAADRGTERAG